MKSSLALLLLTACLAKSAYSPEEIKCSVCKVVVQEMEKEISKVNPNKKINLSHRINEQGKVVEKSRLYARSEVHLSELMDAICDKMDNYVRVTNKTTGQLEIVPIITDSGKMNPKFGEYEVIQDSDLNKSLKFYCESIVEEFDEEINSVLNKESTDPHIKICIEETKICEGISLSDRHEL